MQSLLVEGLHALTLCRVWVSAALHPGKLEEQLRIARDEQLRDAELAEQALEMPADGAYGWEDDRDESE